MVKDNLHSASANQENRTIFDYFTPNARRILVLSNQQAVICNSPLIDFEHVLLAIARADRGGAHCLLKEILGNPEILFFEAEQFVPRKKHREPKHIMLPQTARAKQIIVRAIREARDLNDNFVGTSHLLLGLIAECNAGDSVMQVIGRLNLSYDRVRSVLIEMRKRIAEKDKGERDFDD